MNEQALDVGADALRRRLKHAAPMVSLPAVVLLFLYLAAVVRIEASEWRALVLALLAGAAIIRLVLGRAARASLAPVLRYLDDLDSSEQNPDVVGAAYAAAMRYPQSFCLQRLLSWLVGVCVIPVGMALQGETSWFFGARMGALLVYAVGGAAISSTFAYYVARSTIGDVRRRLAADLHDPTERSELAPRVSLSSKLQVAFVTSVIGWLVLGLGVSVQAFDARLGDAAAAWQRLALERIEAELSTQGGEAGSEASDVANGLAGAIARILPEPSLQAYATTFRQADRSAIETLAAPDVISQRLAAALDRGERQGRLVDFDESLLVSWRALPDDRVLVALLDTRGLGGGFSASTLLLLVVLLLAGGGTLLLGRMLAADVHGAVRGLVSEANRVAAGDLRPGSLDESDDELADLARAFDRMRGALRATVGRVVEAADRVETTVAEIDSVGGQVSAASQEQAAQVRHAGNLMDQINAQVGGVTGSAQQLGESVEESSSSILELGVASEELNDTASVLAEKIESVSSSIEEMVQSVQQVSDNTSGLADAASDTSASMEEMASAMRAVDTTAERTGGLSLEVVTAAEGGHAKVGQTIEGMHAIQDATDAAEQVIRGLGARAEEIGAILDVIEDVGDETTLLALNAAIIAAQSGEQGRAFSVVADEIKELAERVLASAKEIGTLIRSVQDEVANAVSAIAVGSSSVAGGVDLSAEAGGALEEITRAARESGSRIGEIVAAVRDQTHAAVGVVELMDRVSDGVNEIRAAGVEQRRGHDVVLRSSLAIRDVAHQVKRTTEEQAAGFGRIRASIEGVQDTAERINTSLAEQSAACTQVARFLDGVSECTEANDEAMSSMGESVKSLARQAKTLREDMAKFRI